jgi:hypothetical protein
MLQVRGGNRYALLMNARIKYVKGQECAPGMGQRPNFAVVKDARIKLRREECA